MKKKWWIVVKSKTFNGSIGRCMCLRAGWGTSMFVKICEDLLRKC